jgi:hypothetical protein
LRWQHGRALPPELDERLGPTEKKFFREYDRLLMDYMKPRKGVGIDLTLVSGAYETLAFQSNAYARLPLGNPVLSSASQ